jgi:hypothetical protein
MQELGPLLSRISPAFDSWTNAVREKINELEEGLAGAVAPDLPPWYDGTFIQRLKRTPELTEAKARLILGRFRRVERATDRLTQVLSRRVENDRLLVLLRNVIVDFVTVESALLRCYPQFEPPERPRLQRVKLSPRRAKKKRTSRSSSSSS